MTCRLRDRHRRPTGDCYVHAGPHRMRKTFRLWASLRQIFSQQLFGYEALYIAVGRSVLVFDWKQSDSTKGESRERRRADGTSHGYIDELTDNSATSFRVRSSTLSS